jgi:ADP-ribose pyrophosphatase
MSILCITRSPRSVIVGFRFFTTIFHMGKHLHDDKPLLHQGTRVNLRATELRKRGGGVLRREIAEVSDAVVILPLLDPQTVVLIRNERFVVYETLWELPAGTLEDGEDPDACAARELEEETGYRCDTLRKLTGFWPSPGFSTEFMHAYVAQDLTKVGQSLDETERIEPVTVAIGEVMQMVHDGRIVDGKTIATLLWWERFGQS